MAKGFIFTLKMINVRYTKVAGKQINEAVLGSHSFALVT
jgi:hypothetical protein